MRHVWAPEVLTCKVFHEYEKFRLLCFGRLPADGQFLQEPSDPCKLASWEIISSVSARKSILSTYLSCSRGYGYPIMLTTPSGHFGCYCHEQLSTFGSTNTAISLQLYPVEPGAASAINRQRLF